MNGSTCAGFVRSASYLQGPATLPLPEIVEQLNKLRAPGLYGFASMLARLAAEARAGRLRINPLAVSSTSETLLLETRAAITDAFGVPVVDTFGSTEGLVGTSAPGDVVLAFNTDLCIVELVDADNRPVPPGVPSAKVLVTNLYNLVQPLIRYELPDSFVRQPDAPGPRPPPSPGAGTLRRGAPVRRGQRPPARRPLRHGRIPRDPLLPGSADTHWH